MDFSRLFQNVTDFIHSTLPGEYGVIVFFIVGWLVALLIRKIVHGLMKKTEWDERLLGNTIVDTNKFVANFVYYILLVIILLVVLEMMGVSYVLDPIRNMLNEFLTYIDNIFVAIALVFIGYVFAKFASNLIKMAGSFLDRVFDSIGFKDTEKLIHFIQQVVFVVVFIPFIILALNALQLEAITQPANNILHKLMDAVPHIIGAILIIVIFYIGGKFITSFLHDVLANLGTDSLSKKMNLFFLSDEQSLSKIISNVVFFFVMFFGIVTGVEMLEFERLSEVLHTMLNLSGNILFGLFIMILGNMIASVIYSAMSKKKEGEFAAGVSRVAIIGLFLAIALRTMGIANSIIDLAFGLTLGSLAVTVALAYGLGGREAAGKHMEKILKKFQKD